MGAPPPSAVSGQAALAATTLTDVYTTASHQKNVILYVKTIIICNRGAGATTFRIAYAPLGAADDSSQYISYDEAIGANARVMIDFIRGIRLAPADVIRVYTAGASVTASVFVDSVP